MKSMRMKAESWAGSGKVRKSPNLHHRTSKRCENLWHLISGGRNVKFQKTEDKKNIAQASKEEKHRLETKDQEKNNIRNSQQQYWKVEHRDITSSKFEEKINFNL